MRLIDMDAFEVDALKSVSLEFDAGVIYALEMLDKAPTVDAVPVVLCKKCKHRYDMMKCPLRHAGLYTADESYCSHGERKSDNE